MCARGTIEITWRHKTNYSFSIFAQFFRLILSASVSLALDHSLSRIDCRVERCIAQQGYKLNNLMHTNPCGCIGKFVANFCTTGGWPTESRWCYYYSPLALFKFLPMPPIRYTRSALCSFICPVCAVACIVPLPIRWRNAAFQCHSN